MTLRHLSADGPRDPDEVWDRYVRPRRWPEWSPQIRGVDYAYERLAAGTSGVVHGPAGLPVSFRVVEVDEPDRSWLWTATAAGVRLTLRHTVRPAGEGTRTGLTVEGPAAVVLLYLPVARLALQRLVT